MWNYARDNLLGTDDFSRVVSNVGDPRISFWDRLKALGTGAAELGTTASMFIPGIGSLAAASKVPKLGMIVKGLAPTSNAERMVLGGSTLAGAAGASVGENSPLASPLTFGGLAGMGGFYGVRGIGSLAARGSKGLANSATPSIVAAEHAAQPVTRTASAAGGLPPLPAIEKAAETVGTMLPKFDDGAAAVAKNMQTPVFSNGVKASDKVATGGAAPGVVPPAVFQEPSLIKAPATTAEATMPSIDDLVAGTTENAADIARAEAGKTETLKWYQNWKLIRDKETGKISWTKAGLYGSVAGGVGVAGALAGVNAMRGGETEGTYPTGPLTNPIDMALAANDKQLSQYQQTINGMYKNRLARAGLSIDEQNKAMTDLVNRYAGGMSPAINDMYGQTVGEYSNLVNTINQAGASASGQVRNLGAQGAARATGRAEHGGLAGATTTGGMVPVTGALLDAPAIERSNSANMANYISGAAAAQAKKAGFDTAALAQYGQGRADDMVQQAQLMAMLGSMQSMQQKSQLEQQTLSEQDSALIQAQIQHDQTASTYEAQKAAASIASPYRMYTLRQQWDQTVMKDPKTVEWYKQNQIFNADDYIAAVLSNPGYEFVNSGSANVAAQ
jgi:hypothetical protein